MTARAEKRASVKAFTLMEMLIVIVILATLMSIGLVAAANFRRDARVKQIRAVLDACKSAALEYRVATGLVVNHSAYNAATGATTNVKPFEWETMANDNTMKVKKLGKAEEDTDAPDNSAKATHVYIERFVWAAMQIPSARKLLESRKMLDDTDRDGFQEIVDPLGNALAYAAFVSHDDTRDRIPKDNYLPERTEPFFASAGMDGKWGQAKSEDELGAAAYQDYLDSNAGRYAKENLFSFPYD